MLGESRDPVSLHKRNATKLVFDLPADVVVANGFDGPPSGRRASLRLCGLGADEIALQHGGAVLCDGAGLAKTFVGLMLDRAAHHS